MSKIKKLLETCESCGNIFPLGTLTKDNLCIECEEMWWEDQIRKTKESMYSVARGMKLEHFETYK